MWQKAMSPTKRKQKQRIFKRDTFFFWSKFHKKCCQIAINEVRQSIYPKSLRMKKLQLSKTVEENILLPA